MHYRVVLILIGRNHPRTVKERYNLSSCYVSPCAVLSACCLLPSCEQRLENGERFHIMFAIQLIRCPFLNPRIRGVVILSNIIDVIIRNAAR